MRLKAFLKTLQGRRVYFEPLSGNHGDQLLTLSAEHLMSDAGIYPVKSPASADMILLNGGGSMVDGWNGLQKLKSLSEQYPRIPLAVLPSSYLFKAAHLQAVVGNRTAPMWLWAREEVSLSLLREAELPACVHLHIDHDLAFFLADTEWLKSLKNLKPENRLLIVERDDWEGPTGRRRVLAPPGLEFIPESWRTSVRKHLLGPLRRRQEKASPFRRAALDYIHQQQPDTAGFPYLSADISLEEVCDFDTFLQQIANASYIITTRLHVAIVAHLLNRNVGLVDGSYHKFSGVYDYSMRFGPCSLLRWDRVSQQLNEIQPGEFSGR